MWRSLALALLLAGCASLVPRPPPVISGPGIVWVPTSPQEVVDTCGESNDVGCAFLTIKTGGCVIVTPTPPPEEFTPYIESLKSSAWLILAHEVAHCFGWTHPDIGPPKPPGSARRSLR